MPRFLLGTNAFVDMARAAGTPVRNWILAAHKQQGITDLDLAISVMSLAILARQFTEAPLTAQKVALQNRCSTLAQEYRDRRAILAVTDSDVTSWAQIRSLNLQYVHKNGEAGQVGFEEQLVLATALARRLTLIDRKQPAHRELAPLGLLVEDPFPP